MLLVLHLNSGFYKRNNFSQNYLQFWYASPQVLASRITGRKCLKNIGLKGREILGCQGRHIASCPELPRLSDRPWVNV
jgi:hypothetical protein